MKTLEELEQEMEDAHDAWEAASITEAAYYAIKGTARKAWWKARKAYRKKLEEETP